MRDSLMTSALQLKAFASKYKADLGSSVRAVAQAIEKSEANVAWMDLYYQEIWDWLRVQNKVGVMLSLLLLPPPQDSS
jgi:hypothetical protein